MSVHIENPHPSQASHHSNFTKFPLFQLVAGLLSLQSIQSRKVRTNTPTNGQTRPVMEVMIFRHRRGVPTDQQTSQTCHGTDDFLSLTGGTN